MYVKQSALDLGMLDLLLAFLAILPRQLAINVIYRGLWIVRIKQFVWIAQLIK